MGGRAQAVFLGTTRGLLAEGDSITAVLGSYVDKFRPNASPATNILNASTVGAGISTMDARGGVIDTYLPQDRGSNKYLLSVLIGANDLLLLGAATWCTNLAAYLDKRRAAGWYVVLCNVLPRTAPGFAAERATANATIAGWVGTHCDAICDFAADPTMGPDAAAANTSLYSDGTHPTDSGHATLELVYRAKINSI